MIYTVTFNPSIDYIVNVDNFMTGVVNRTSKEIIFPGGKGINVSMVLKNLGEESTALGFMAGFTGDAITAARYLQDSSPFPQRYSPAINTDASTIPPDDSSMLLAVHAYPHPVPMTL